VKCYFPVGSVEKIRLLEDAVVTLTGEVEYHKTQTQLADYRFQLLVSWWDLNNTQLLPVLRQGWQNSQRSLHTYRCFQSLALLATELVMNPQRKDVLLPQLQNLEAGVLEETQEGEVTHLVKALIIYHHLANMFFQARLMEWAKLYASKIDKSLKDNFPLLAIVDQDLLTNCIQIAARVSSDVELASAEEAGPSLHGAQNHKRKRKESFHSQCSSFSGATQN